MSYINLVKFKLHLCTLNGGSLLLAGSSHVFLDYVCCVYVNLGIRTTSSFRLLLTCFSSYTLTIFREALK